MPISKHVNSDAVKPAVLILDADVQHVEVANSCLNKQGYSCYSSFNTRSADNLISTHRDIGILLVSVSNRQEHFRFTDKILRQHTPQRDMEVIFFAERMDEKKLLRALRMNVSDFLQLPFEPRLLLSSVDQACARLTQRIKQKEGEDSGRRVVREIRTMLTDLVERLDQTHNAGSDYLQKKDVRSATVNDAHPLQKIAKEPSMESRSAINKVHRIIRAKRQFFSRKVNSDYSLNMLLELYAIKEKKREMPVTALCYSSGTAQTTALRRLEILEKEGFLKRLHDVADKRRVLIRLTSAGEREVRRYLDFIAEI